MGFFEKIKKEWLIPGLIALLGLTYGVINGEYKRVSKIEEYHAEKHRKDSTALAEQQRSLDFYQQQLDSLLPQADSLIALFKYEKNEKYQDRGYYVIDQTKLKTPLYDLRIMVRDDGKEVVAYREGKRLTDEQVYKLTHEGKSGARNAGIRAALERAQHLQIIIHDINELEKRIGKTSLEIKKYEKRMNDGMIF